VLEHMKVLIHGHRQVLKLGEGGLINKMRIARREICGERPL